MSSDKLKGFLYPGSGHNEINAGVEDTVVPAPAQESNPEYGKGNVWQQNILQLHDVPYPDFAKQQGSSLVLRLTKKEVPGVSTAHYTVSWEPRLDKLSAKADWPIEIVGGTGYNDDPFEFKLADSDKQNGILVGHDDGSFEYKNPQELSVDTAEADAATYLSAEVTTDGWDHKLSIEAGLKVTADGTNLNRIDPDGLYAGNKTPAVVQGSGVKTTTTTSTSGVSAESELRLSTDPDNSIIVQAAGTAKVSNTVLKWNNESKVITFTDNKGNTKDIDLSQFVSDIHVDNADFDPETSILTLYMKDEDGTELPPIKIDLGELSKTKIEQSPSILLTGNGSGVTPLRADLNISGEEGNALEVKSDGAYVNAPVVGHTFMSRNADGHINTITEAGFPGVRIVRSSNANPNTVIAVGSVAVGNYSSAQGNGAVAIGQYTKADYQNSVALGNSATTARDFEVSIGDADTTRFLANVRNPELPQDAATKGYVDNKSSSVAWNDITGKPTNFPTTWDSVASKPTIYPTNWNNVAGKPSGFIPPTGHGAVGTYAMVITQSGTQNFSWGQTRAGSGLRVSNTTASVGEALTGTWRCMSFIFGSTNAGIAVRIS